MTWEALISSLCLNDQAAITTYLVSTGLQFFNSSCYSTLDVGGWGITIPSQPITPKQSPDVAALSWMSACSSPRHGSLMALGSNLHSSVSSRTLTISSRSAGEWAIGPITDETMFALPSGRDVSVCYRDALGGNSRVYSHCWQHPYRAAFPLTASAHTGHSSRPASELKRLQTLSDPSRSFLTRKS